MWEGTVWFRFGVTLFKSSFSLRLIHALVQVVQNDSLSQLGPTTTALAWICVACASSGLVLLFK
jgi:hypothetical protein